MTTESSSSSSDERFLPPTAPEVGFPRVLVLESSKPLLFAPPDIPLAKPGGNAPKIGRERVGECSVRARLDDVDVERDTEDVRGEIRMTSSPSLLFPPSSSKISSTDRFRAFLEGEGVAAVVEDDDDDVGGGNLLPGPVYGISGLTDLVDRRTDCARILLLLLVTRLS